MRDPRTDRTAMLYGCEGGACQRKRGNEADRPDGTALAGVHEPGVGQKAFVTPRERVVI